MIQLSSYNEIFGKLLLISKCRPIDLKEVFSYPLGPVPWSLATPLGGLVKTNKANLMHELEKGVIPLTREPSEYCSIIDGMALVRKLQVAGKTFDEFAVLLFESSRRMSKKASRIDIVFDVYRDLSIKNAERSRRSDSSANAIFQIIIGSQPIRQWTSFLSNNQNKNALVEFLKSKFDKLPNDILQPMYITCRNCCYKSGVHGTEEVVELSCSHEEADTRMLLHAQHASNTHHCIVIHTPDTDVFLIALSVLTSMGIEIFVRTGTGNSNRIISLSQIKDNIVSLSASSDDDLVIKSILGLHSFTGCDTVSAFSGKGKIKPLKLMLQHQPFMELFAMFGTNWELSEDTVTRLESFVCQMYGKNVDCVNELRHLLFQSRSGKVDGKNMLPPCKDSVLLHFKRANYQLNIWRRCLLPMPDTPSPDGHGWEIERDTITITWNTVQQAPNVLLEMLACECKRKCIPISCSCIQNNFKCTEACALSSCDNYDPTYYLNEVDDDFE